VAAGTVCSVATLELLLGEVCAGCDPTEFCALFCAFISELLAVVLAELALALAGEFAAEELAEESGVIVDEDEDGADAVVSFEVVVADELDPTEAWLAELPAPGVPDVPEFTAPGSGLLASTTSFAPLLAVVAWPV